MNTASSDFARLAKWFKKNTEGEKILHWISYFMIFSVLVIFILEYPTGDKLDWRFYGTVLTLGVLLVMNILWFQSHKQLFFHRNKLFFLWAFNIGTNLLILAAFAFTGRSEVVYLLFMQTAQFASMFEVWPKGTIYSAISLGIALVIIKFYGESNAGLIQTAAEFLTGIIFVLVFVLLEERSSQATRRAENLLKDLQAANIELKTAQQKEKELAIAEERMRLARDIHDGLGHHLTVLSIQLQAADKLVERNPQAAAEAIRTSRAEAQAALEEVRRSVGVMRQLPAESQPLPEMLANLVHDFSEHTGLQANFEVIGTPVELSAFAGQTLFRTVQESLTNVQKHGQDVKHIQVKLEYTPEAIRLIVSDDGRQPDRPSDEQPGYGLKGLQERVDQLGGKFCCGPDSHGGFQVDVTIPLQEVTHDQSPAGR
ncbi:MAG TPA: sensor histidine kinase [Anaerolineales bacterium]|nr:sensor histidine kinase [Anaerolineales bacterium]